MGDFVLSLAAGCGWLIGGGRSTLIIGLIAVTLRIPVVAALAYGGNAEEVWKVLDSRQDLPTAEEINAMAKPGSVEVAREWVASLDAQRRARKRQSGGLRRIAIVAAMLLVAWVAALPVGFILLKSKTSASELPQPLDMIFIALLFISPLIAGASGATLRALLPGQQVMSTGSSVLGAAAGAISSLLYVGAQLLSSGAGGGSPNNFALLLFAVSFGFIAGFTFDSVFKRLESANALQPDALLKRTD